MNVRRHEIENSGSERGWNIDLGELDQSDAYTYETKLKRITLKFATSDARSRFSGNQSLCTCAVKSQLDLEICLRAGHRGIWGEVKEFLRRRSAEDSRRWHDSSRQIRPKPEGLNKYTDMRSHLPNNAIFPSAETSDTPRKFIAGEKLFNSFREMVAFADLFCSSEDELRGLIDSVQWVWEIPTLFGSLDDSSGSILGNQIILTIGNPNPGHDLDKTRQIRPYAFTCNEWLHTDLSPAWRGFFVELLRKLEHSLAESESGSFSQSTFFVPGKVNNADKTTGLDLGSQTYAYSKGSWAINWNYDRQNLRLFAPATDLRPELSELSELIEIVGWLCRALRKPRHDHEIKLTRAAYRLDIGKIQPFSRERAKRPVILFEDVSLRATVHDCWKQLFTSCTVADIQSLERLVLSRSSEKSQMIGQESEPFGEGLETSFDLMVALSAVEFPVVVDGGVVFVGYDTILVPTAINDAGTAAQFHIITTESRDEESRESVSAGQINPYQTNLGQRLFTSDASQFRRLRCFLGWCESAQINLGTQHLRADVGYSGCREKGESLHID